MMDIGRDLQAAYDDGYQARDDEIIRCKDCKFMEHAVNGKGEHGYRCNNSNSPVDNNRLLDDGWYCADGERREE